MASLIDEISVAVAGIFVVRLLMRFFPGANVEWKGLPKRIQVFVKSEMWWAAGQALCGILFPVILPSFVETWFRRMPDWVEPSVHSAVLFGSFLWVALIFLVQARIRWARWAQALFSLLRALTIIGLPFSVFAYCVLFSREGRLWFNSESTAYPALQSVETPE